MSQIPAPRAKMVETETGEITRVWYSFLRDSLALSIRSVDDDVSVGNEVSHLLCDGTLTVSLASASSRDRVLTIKNIGTGTVTVEPISGETVDGASSVSMADQWDSVQLLPVAGGYVKL